MNRHLCIIALFLLTTVSAWGWGRLGHATVARIAEQHLTEKAKKEIAQILNNESIVLYASYPDEEKNSKHMLYDYGVNFTDGSKRVNTLPHTFESDMNFKPFRGFNDNGRFVKNCIHFIEMYANDLKTNKELSQREKFLRLVSIVHFVGDMHCPEHVRYYPEDMTIGKYMVKYNGADTQYHTYWDEYCITSRFPFSFTDVAYLLDTYTAEQYKEIVKGDPYDWGADVAKCVYHIHKIKEGDTIKRDWINNTATPLVKSQLTKAGYRLAELLNRTFK